jgi:hypothetical protein
VRFFYFYKNHLKTYFMKSLKITILTLFVAFSLQLSAQKAKMLSKVPETKEEFLASEPNVIATVDWIETSPINEDEELHKLQYALLMAWLTDSPTVTLSLEGYVMDYTKKNSELLIVFMGGWARYSLQNEYATDAIQCNLAGIQSMIKVYKTGKLKKDKKMEELVALESKGELETWLKGKVTAK